MFHKEHGRNVRFRYFVGQGHGLREGIGGRVVFGPARLNLIWAGDAVTLSHPALRLLSWLELVVEWIVLVG